MQETVLTEPSAYEKLSSEILGQPVPQSEEMSIEAPEVKKYKFTKGETAFEVDEDAENEMMADKKPLKLTLRELKDRAAGDVAIKNRMHALAEEKKKIQGTFKEFSTLAKKDPLSALEFIVKQAQEADSELEYNKYLTMLADQAERLGQMDEPQRKAYETEKKLSKVEQDLALKDRQEKALTRKSEILSEYPELASQFDHMLDSVLASDEIMSKVESEEDILNRVEDLMEETLLQRDIIKLIKKVNPSQVSNDELIFTLSDQIRANPDFDEQDVTEILKELLQPYERREASKRLSEKQRDGSTIESLQARGASDYEILKAKLQEKKKGVRNVLSD